MVNDGIGNGNFTTLKPFAFWTQHVLPLVYGDEISYMETLGKMRDILNELIKNNNNLPEYIQKMIEEYISSGAIEEVIDKILSNFILNVKYPPTGVPKAKGDGTTNDHDSIQGCIDYAATNGGGIVYIPAGKYLTSPLVLKSGVTLLGFGRYAVSLVLDGGATTHLITGAVSDAGILNMTLDAKMSSQVNRVDAIELISNHIDIRGCLVRDCYTSINVQKNGTAVNICDVICEVASDACLRIGGTNGGLLVDGLDMTGLSTNLGNAYIVTDSNDDIYRNINIHGSGAIGIDVSGSGNYFDGNISGVTKDYDDSIGDNTFNLFGKTRVENLTGEVVVNANAFYQTAESGIERQGANISDNAVNTHTINAKDVVINPTNPLTYKKPSSYNTFFDKINFKDSTGATYNVLVGNAKTNDIIEYVTPEDFGAIGDGVADDTSALTQCFNSGKFIKCPAKTYYFTQIINCLVPVNCDLGNATFKTDKLVTFLSLRDKANIKGGNIVSSGSTYTSGGNAIKIESNTKEIILDSINIEGFVVGIYFDGGLKAIVKNCKISNNKYIPSIAQGGYSILLENSQNILISNNTFNGGTGQRHLLYISRSSFNVTVIDNIFDMTEMYALFEPIISIRDTHDTFIVNNRFYGGSEAIYLYGTSPKAAYNVIISGNSFSKLSDLVSGQHNFITVSLAEGGTEKVTSTIISNNIFQQNTSTLDNLAYGLVITGDGIVVDSNAFIGNFIGGMLISSAKPIITGNSFYNATTVNGAICMLDGAMGTIIGFQGKIFNSTTGTSYTTFDYEKITKIAITNGVLTITQNDEYLTAQVVGDSYISLTVPVLFRNYNPVVEFVNADGSKNTMYSVFVGGGETRIYFEGTSGAIAPSTVSGTIYATLK